MGPTIHLGPRSPSLKEFPHSDASLDIPFRILYSIDSLPPPRRPSYHTGGIVQQGEVWKQSTFDSLALLDCNPIGLYD